jgi:septation ring formation regulator EzrA
MLHINPFDRKYPGSKAPGFIRRVAFFNSPISNLKSIVSYYFFRKQIARAIVIFACCLLTVSCSESRVVQCNKFTAIVTKGNGFIDTKKDRYDAGTTKNLAKDLNQIAKEIESLRLTDTNLKQIQKQSVKSFRDLSQGLGDIGKAFEAANRASISIEGREQIKKAQVDSVRAGQQAKQAVANQAALTEKLINYCNSDRS